MAVSQQFQSKGIGGKLLSALIDLANNWLNIQRLELEVVDDNPGAIALYKKHGFVVKGKAKSLCVSQRRLR